MKRNHAPRHLGGLSLLAFLAVALPPSAHAVIDVWIDPGHGGSDTGAPGFNGGALPNEEELTLAVSQSLELNLLVLGFISRLTRNTDTFFELDQRAQIASGELANDQGFTDTCDLFISMHMNSNESATPFGTETYYSPVKFFAKQKSEFQSSKDAADTIHPDLVANAALVFIEGFCNDDRGVKAKKFRVLRKSKTPAILIETCFISNFCQWTEIQKAGDQNLIASGIAAGVSGYLNSPPKPASERVYAEHELPPPAPPLRGLTLQEGFEGGTFPPSGWSVQTSGAPAPHNWARVTEPSCVGTGVGAAAVVGAYASAYDEELISPAVVLGPGDNSLKFSWGGSQFWSAAVNPSVSIRQVGQMSWTELWSVSVEPLADPFIYRNRIVDISSFNGQTVEFRFRVSGTDGGDFYLDDVEVGDFPPTQAPPFDTCLAAAVLSSPFDLTDVTCYGANDLDPYVGPPSSCVGTEMGGQDVFYEIAAAAGDTLLATVIAEWGVGLYLVDDCAVPTCLAGAYEQDGANPPSIEYEFTSAGTYYLVVDGETDSCGPFNLTGEIRPTAVSAPNANVRKDVAMRMLPNPSRGPVLVQARVDGATTGTLAVFDVGGKVVIEKHVDLSSGELRFHWDGRDRSDQRVGPGVYFVRLQAGGQTLEDKLTLLR